MKKQNNNHLWLDLKTFAKKDNNRFSLYDLETKGIKEIWNLNDCLNYLDIKFDPSVGLVDLSQDVLSRHLMVNLFDNHNLSDHMVIKYDHNDVDWKLYHVDEIDHVLNNAEIDDFESYNDPIDALKDYYRFINDPNDDKNIASIRDFRFEYRNEIDNLNNPIINEVIEKLEFRQKGVVNTHELERLLFEMFEKYQDKYIIKTSTNQWVDENEIDPKLIKESLQDLVNHPPKHLKEHLNEIKELKQILNNNTIKR